MSFICCAGMVIVVGHIRLWAVEAALSCFRSLFYVRSFMTDFISHCFPLPTLHPSTTQYLKLVWQLHGEIVHILPYSLALRASVLDIQHSIHPQVSKIPGEVLLYRRTSHPQVQDFLVTMISFSSLSRISWAGDCRTIQVLYHKCPFL